MICTQRDTQVWARCAHVLRDICMPTLGATAFSAPQMLAHQCFGCLHRAAEAA